MRDGLDAATLALYTSGEFELHTRLSVENGSGTRVNLSGRYTKYDLRLPDPSQPIGSLSIDFIRESTAAGAVQSLAPTVVASNLNRLDDGVTYSPLLQLGRLVYFDVALTAVGAARPDDASTLWYEVFRGYITKVDWPQWDSRRASIECNDQAGILEIAKSEQAYTYVAGTPIETVARQILDNNGFTDVPLYFPAATGKVLPNDYTPGLQKTVWSQLWALAQSMGWVAFYRYRGHNPPELTFFAPAREKTEPDMTVDAYDFRALGISEQEVRNVGYLAFFDAVGAQQLIGPFENAASIAKYGGSKQIRRPFWIKLEEDSPIRSTAEATDMLNAALSDVADPDAIASALLPPMVFAESGVDLYEFVANPRLFDSNQTLAPFSITVSQEAGQDPVSTVDVRGVPTAGAQTWRSLATDEEPTPTDNGVIFKSAQWENYATGPHGQTGLRVKALFDLGRDVKTLRIRYSYYGILANPPGGEPGYYTLDVDVSAEPRSTWVRLYPYDIDGIGDATDPVDITVWPIDSLGNLGTERKFDLDPYDDTGEVGFRVYDGVAMQTSKYVVAGTNITIDKTASNELRINATTDLAGYVPTSRQVIAGAGLTGGGALSGNITINVASHPGTANTVGTLVVEADRVGVALGNTSTTAAPGNHPLGGHPGYLDVTKGGTGLEITAIGRARAVILDPGGSSTALQRLEAPTGAVRYLSASDTGVISWQTISLSGAVPSVGAGWIGRVLQVNGESTYGWGLRLPNVSGPVGQALVSVGAPGGILEAQWGDVDWQYIANKPATFAPAAHTHLISEVTGLQAALDGKAAASHTHTIAQVTGLQAALDGKANLSGATFTGEVRGLAEFSWGFGSSSNPAWLQHSATTNAERGGYGIWLVWNAHKSDTTTWVHDRTTLASAYRVGVSHHDQGLAFYSGNNGLGAGTVDTWTRVFHVSPNGAGTFTGSVNAPVLFEDGVSLENKYAAKVHSHDASIVFNAGNVPVAYGGTGRDMSGLTGLVHVASGLFQHIAPNPGGTPQVLQSSFGSWTLGTISGTISALGSTAGQVLQSTGSAAASYNWGVKLPNVSGPVGQPLVAQGAPGGVVTIDYGSVDAQYITGTFVSPTFTGLVEMPSANNATNMRFGQRLAFFTASSGYTHIGFWMAHDGTNFVNTHASIRGSALRISNTGALQWQVAQSTGAGPVSISTQWEIGPDGVLAAGAVPASRVSAGAFGAGNFSFTSATDTWVSINSSTSSADRGIKFTHNGGDRSAFGFTNSSGVTWIEAFSHFQIQSAGVVNLRVAANGNVGIGYSTNQSYKLAVNGSGYYAGALTVSGNATVDGTLTAAGLYDSTVASTRRIKDAVEDFCYNREALLALRPRQWRYNFNAPDRLRGAYGAGFVAEEVHPIFADERREGVFFNRITAQLVWGWQDHDRTLRDHGFSIESNRQRIERLERENAELRHRLAMAEAAWRN